MVVESRKRVLVVAAGSLREALMDQLAGEGFDVADTEAGEDVVQWVRRFKPDLVLVGEALPRRAGRQVVLSLRAHGDTFKTPVAGVLNAVPVPTVLDWFRVGATDLWRFPFTKEVPSRTMELIEECERSLVHLGHMKTRVLAWAGRARLTGMVRWYAGTPFEGRAGFTDGQLRHAQFGSRTGEKALEALLELEDGAMRWDEGLAAPEVKAAPLDGYKPRVMVAEDDASLRRVLVRQLEAAGCTVEGVGSGDEALKLAPRHRWDVIIADLNLPGLDGWGVLRSLKADVELREVPVVFLSGLAQTVDALKLAKAGARAYLHKPARAKELLDTIHILCQPRATVWNALSRRTSCAIELRVLGAAWLLRALAELDCRGKLELEDSLGRYELEVARGQLVSARAQTGSLSTAGPLALQTILASPSSGTFSFKKVEVPKGARWLYEQLDESCDLMRREEAARLTRAVSRPRALEVNEELVRLYAPIATVDQLRVLDAVLTAEDVSALATHTGIPQAEVEAALATLLRRGVLSA